MTPETHDDGFHEIQLTGKQLVFLFMAATVVSVVIFLCGVLVGRGVRIEQLTVSAAPQTGEDTSDNSTRPLRSNQSSTPLPALPPADPAATPPPVVNERVDTPPAAAPVTPPPVAEAPRPAPTPAPAPPPPAPAPTVSNPPPSTRTAAATPPVTTPKPQPPAGAPRPAAATSASAAASTTSTAKPSPAPAASPAMPATAGPGGWQVQVAAYDARGDAEAHVRRLGTRGYKAYVATPAGTSNVFRVRVGPFPNKAAADAVSARLSKEERITPWVTR